MKVGCIGFFDSMHLLPGHPKCGVPHGHTWKVEVIALGARMGVPLGLTWSCYRDGARPCRRCSACRGRLQSFRNAGMEDPS